MPDRRKRKKRISIRPETYILIKQCIIGFFLFSLVGLIIYGIWYVTRLEQVTIDQVEVTGHQTVAEERIQQKTNAVLDESAVLGLIPNRFTFTYPRQQIEAVLQEIPRIAKVEIEIKNRTTVMVTVEEYVPDALWCDYDSLETCYFLNDEGVAFAPSPRLSGGSFIRYVRSGRDPERNLSLIEEIVLEDIDWFMFHLQQLFNFYPILIALYEDDRVVYTTADGRQILITLRQGVDETLQHLEVFFGSEEFLHLRDESFEYIDARFGNRIFLKEFPTEEEDEQGEDEIATTTIMTATSTEPQDLTNTDE